jgi:uncharacterized membrane protein HdeD (DUF308 family)
MEMIEICTAPMITAICYGIIELIKRVLEHERMKNAYPLISALVGASLGIVAYFAEPTLMMSDSVFGSALIGMLSGLSATGGNELVRRVLSYFRET